MFEILNRIPENIKTILAWVIIAAFSIPLLFVLIDKIDWDGVFDFLITLLIMFLVGWAFWYLFL